MDIRSIGASRIHIKHLVHTLVTSRFGGTELSIAATHHISHTIRTRMLVFHFGIYLRISR